MLSDVVNEAYSDAARVVSADTGRERADLPSRCPYTIEQLLDDSHLP